MKLTKVEKTRIAVKRVTKGEERVVLYKNPSNKSEVKPVSEQIVNRIDNANKLYNVFFRSDIPSDLKEHFREIVQIGKMSESALECYNNIKGYYGYYDKNKKFHRLNKDVYNPAGKSLRLAMLHFVQECMSDYWQKPNTINLVLDLLVCICKGSTFSKKIEDLYKKENFFKKFWSICKDSKELYVPKNTSELENNFNLLMKNMVMHSNRQVYEKENDKEIEQNIQKQINYLKNVHSLRYVDMHTKREGDKKLSSISYEYATQQRMKAVIVRMRKSLKRGDKGRVAIQLLQGLAQKDGMTLQKSVESLENENPVALKKFIDAVNRDYYRVNIVKSVRNINVKVQPENGILCLSSVQDKNSKHPNKKALNDTLLMYAASPENADKILWNLKAIVFDYFLCFVPETVQAKLKLKYLVQDEDNKMLWKMPHTIEGNKEVYFDSFFSGECNDENRENIALENLFDASNGRKISQGKIKNRIKYINYGIYLKKSTENEENWYQYWLQFIKEFVEKHYLKKEYALKKESCFITSMMSTCWKNIIQFLCGKYIDIGKSVYHFTQFPNPTGNNCENSYGNLLPECREGISSFAYESIKAEESLQREISNAVVAAAASFSRSTIDYDLHKKLMEKIKNSEDPKENRKNVEDIMFIEKADLESILKGNLRKSILRFYGGESQFDIQINKHSQDEYVQQQNFAQDMFFELLSHLKYIRNNSFHYTPGKTSEISVKYAKLLWKNDAIAYQQRICEQYYSNNVEMFYNLDDIKKTVKKLYLKKTISEAQIPAFRTILQRKELPDYYKRKDGIQIAWERDSQTETIFSGAVYFLLKEIYYRDFILNNDEALKRFFKAVENYRKNMCPYSREDKAADNFSRYVNNLKSKGLTFGNVCQVIQNEYNQQNSGKQKQEIYKHFKMLLPICVKDAFWDYIRDEYNYICHPHIKESTGKQDYLDEVEIYCGASDSDGLEYNEELMKKEQKKYAWHTLAHFLHPRQLNLLIGNLKNYIQYHNDIFRRTGYANDFKSMEERENSWNKVRACVKETEDILEILEFVRVVSGRVSNVFTDYYEDEEEYAKYLNRYIDFPLFSGKSVFECLKYFCYNTLESGNPIDIYTDAENPKILRNVELARMYAGGELCLKGYEKITIDEIKEYYNKKDKVVEILNKGLPQNEEEQKLVVEMQQLKNRITLNEIMNIFMLVSDMLGKLVSMSYLRERDEMYFFLGFYYMLLQNNDTAWSEEEMNSLKTSKHNITKGLVLYQTIGVFDFALNLIYQGKGEKSGETGGSVSTKIMKFSKLHYKSFFVAQRLFENDHYSADYVELRNYIDHMKYYIKQEYSIMDLYNGYYSKLFGYSTKLRKSVWHNFEQILENNSIANSLSYQNGEGKNSVNYMKLNDSLKSLKYTYKLAKMDQKKKTVLLDAKSEKFLKCVKQVLEYKE